jgi:hypothetical protein
MNKTMKKYTFALLDYIWVITIYVSVAFFLSTLVDGHLLPPFVPEEAEKDSNAVLAGKIILQFALQGFFVIVITETMTNLYSPFSSVHGYNPKTDIGLLIRNPTVIAMILFNLSKTLQGRLAILYHRFGRK